MRDSSRVHVAKSATELLGNTVLRIWSKSLPRDVRITAQKKKKKTVFTLVTRGPFLDVGVKISTLNPMVEILTSAPKGPSVTHYENR